jgi:hypothetical protein
MPWELISLNNQDVILPQDVVERFVCNKKSYNFTRLYKYFDLYKFSDKAILAFAQNISAFKHILRTQNISSKLAAEILLQHSKEDWAKRYVGKKFSYESLIRKVAKVAGEELDKYQVIFLTDKNKMLYGMLAPIRGWKQKSASNFAVGKKYVYSDNGHTKAFVFMLTKVKGNKIFGTTLKDKDVQIDVAKADLCMREHKEYCNYVINEFHKSYKTRQLRTHRKGYDVEPNDVNFSSFDKDNLTIRKKRSKGEILL